MKRRKLVWAGLLLVATVAMFRLGKDSEPAPLPPGLPTPAPARPTPPSAHPAAATAPTPTPVVAPPAATLSRPAPAVPPPRAAAPAVADEAARRAGAIAVEKVRRMVLDYHTRMGENPVGTNAEIMEAIMGKNPRQATLGPPEGQSLNPARELVDPWGHPYFFHQLSKDEMEIHSAGPDGVMGTGDDLVQK